MAEREGRVLLVGAGPGDPGLLTLRGLAALRAADVVVYDALATPELLAFAPAEALRIDVGKRGHDAPTRPQEEITDLLVRLAREGRTVVRLKGGDPFVFGRGGEEASACAAAGVPCEVVPGVSSVVGGLAWAGIPLTDRRHAASFAVVTGHKDPSKAASETRWDLLGQAVDTLVILMGMRNLEPLLARVMAGGRSPRTPAAAIMDATLPSQRVVEAPLGELAARVREAGLGAPAVVVIGEVVTLREEIAWTERRPLSGRRVLVTRTAAQAGPMLAALRDAGAEPVLVPLLHLAPPEDWGPVDAALAGLADYDALLLTSVNAAERFAARAAERGVGLAAAPTAACVGPRTAEAALAAGFAVRTFPGSRHDAEALLAALRDEGVAGRRFLQPAADQARQVLPRGLREAGARVDVVTVYRTLPAEVDGAALRARLTAGEIHALTFTSPSTVRHFLALLDPPARAAAARCVVAAIGPVTAETLRKEGLAADIVPQRAEGPELVAALVERLSRGAPS